MRTLTSVVLAALCVLGPTTGVAPAFTVGTPVVVTDGDDQSIAAFAGLADGSTRLVLGLGAGGALVQRIAPAGGAFGPSTPLASSGLRYAQVLLASDGSGLAVVPGGPRSPDIVRELGPASAVSAPLALDPSAVHVSAALAPDGSAALTWLREVAGGQQVVVAFRDAGATSFGPPLVAGYGRTDSGPSVQVADRGRAIVQWSVDDASAYAVRAAGAGTLATPRLLRPRGAVTLSDDGTALDAQQQGRRLRVAFLGPRATRFGPAHEVASSSSAYAGLAAVTTRAGRFGLVWSTGAGSARDPGALRVLAGSRSTAFRAIGTVRGSAEYDDVSLAFNATGAAVLAWNGVDPDDANGDAAARLHVAYATAGGRLGEPKATGPRVQSAEPLGIVFEPTGGALIAFQAFQSGDTRYFRRDEIVRVTP